MNDLAATTDAEARVWRDLEDLPDPEIPVLTLMDLGILRWVKATQDSVTVGVAPTYTGCPATEVIEQSIAERLSEREYENVTVERVLSPPWTTDWISSAGREKLRRYGIAPPVESSPSKRALFAGGDPDIACPRCNSTDTQKVSEFGSTPCKAAYKCTACLEPFEYFKCL